MNKVGFQKSRFELQRKLGAHPEAGREFLSPFGAARTTPPVISFIAARILARGCFLGRADLPLGQGSFGKVFVLEESSLPRCVVKVAEHAKALKELERIERQIRELDTKFQRFCFEEKRLYQLVDAANDRYLTKIACFRMTSRGSELAGGESFARLVLDEEKKPLCERLFQIKYKKRELIKELSALKDARHEQEKRCHSAELCLVEEARLLGKLSGISGVVQLIGLGKKRGDQHCLVMSQATGGTLSNRLKVGPLSSEAVKCLTKEIFQAVAKMHDQGVVHRDIKPANILLDGNGHIQLADFGLGYALCEGETAISSRRVGTPRFMAPELINLPPLLAPKPADVWAVGVVLYYLATDGKFPFDGRDEREQFVGILTQPPKLDEITDVRMRALLMKIFEKDPKKRPTAEQLLKDDYFKTLEEHMMAKGVRKAKIVGGRRLPSRRP